MKNKKGSGFLQFVMNAAILSAIVYFVFAMIFGIGGGFTAIFKAGSFLGGLPNWALGIIAIVFLYLLVGGKKR